MGQRFISSIGWILLAVVLQGQPVFAADSLPEKTERLSSLGKLNVGQPVPWFAAHVVWTSSELINLTKLLKDPGSRKTALVFFTTYCVPCRQGLRMLKEGREKISAASVRVILIDVGEEADVVVPYLKSLGLENFTAVLDKFSVVARNYGVSVAKDDRENIEVPKTVIFDKKGVLLRILGREGMDYVESITAD